MSATERIAAAIIGCGVIGVTHARAIRALPGIATVALVDGRRDAAEALAQQIVDSGAERPRVFGDLGELIASGLHCDLVVVATPSGLHVELGVAALEAGMHVVIEKPIDVDVARARKLGAAAARAPHLVCTVISQHRYDAGNRFLARTIADGRLGRVTSAIASVPWWRSQEYYDSGSWRGTWRLDGGGALMNQGVHTVDVLLWMLGRPVTVSADIALLAHEGVEVEDTATASIRFDSGALAVLHATTAAYPGLGTRLQVMGTDGTAIVEDDDLAYLHTASGETAGRDRADHSAAAGIPEIELPELLTETDDFTRGHIRQYLDVLEALATGRPPRVTVDDALLALATVRAVYVSAVTATRVSIDDVLAGRHDDVTAALPD
ncbi:putative dehydrogenase [Diaminobutyricimonas aerilata]|uniref:Putative dehydrogenase n=1 Tax=Diaminobutyricimonas aerilata TaxID=1162967 RepID=A0A2M9CFW7_9MICO|nr:Gfo/Idh/MocA family oxidoreductase [Diaminobutyricimonas aerilata]PJJ70745.1 putative dehydrogenase [Diaminobutyricimonas aerilata]